jgi:hypothetical protein
MSTETHASILPETTDSQRTLISKMLTASVGQMQGIVCDQVGGYAAAASSNKGFTNRMRFKAHAATRNLRLYFSGVKQGTYPNEMVNFDNSFTVKVAVELASSGSPSGVTIPVTFGGVRVGTCDPGGMLVSDPIGISLADGDVFFLRVMTNATGTYVPINRYISGVTASTGEGVTSPAADAVDSGTITSFDWGSAFAPCAIVGDTHGRQGVIAFGTSITAGAHDRGYDTNVRGWLERAAVGRIGYVNTAFSSETVQNQIKQQRLYNRLILARFAKAAILDTGTNDFYVASRSLAQLQADYQTLIDLLRAAGIPKIIGCTLPPRNTSTDGWQTAGNQTVTANETNRTEFNAWLTGSSSPVDVVIDVLSSIENSVGIWKPNAATVARTTGAGSTTTVVVDSTSSMTVNAYAGKVLSFGGVYSLIQANTASTLTLMTALGSTPGTGVAYSILDTYTPDGVHPATIGHIAMGAAAASVFAAL